MITHDPRTMDLVNVHQFSPCLGRMIFYPNSGARVAWEDLHLCWFTIYLSMHLMDPQDRGQHHKFTLHVQNHNTKNPSPRLLLLLCIACCMHFGISPVTSMTICLQGHIPGIPFHEPDRGCSMWTLTNMIWTLPISSRVCHTPNWNTLSRVQRKRLRTTFCISRANGRVLRLTGLRLATQQWHVLPQWVFFQKILYPLGSHKDPPYLSSI